MFEPSFAGRQYALLDQRYVYQLSQCRDTCDRLKSNLVGNGYSDCVGFILRAPDPYLDTRPVFLKRQVCQLIGIRYQPTVSKNTPTGGTGDQWPLPISSPDELFGYPVQRNNAYPPLVAAFRERDL